ncbi:MAG: M16 family metallopeptidase [Chitinispirillaceae bacterium]
MKLTYTFPRFEETVLSNGLHLIWLEDHEQPVLKLALQIPTGRQFDPPGREATAELASSLAQKGPSSFEAEQFSRKIESAGAQISGDVGEQLISIELHVLQSQASAIVPLFWDMIRFPAMNTKEFSRLRREMLTEMQAEYADPSTLAAKHLQVMVFGRAHPGGRVHTSEAAKRISLEEVKLFWDSFVYPHGATLIVAGAYDGNQRTSWEELFSGWQKSGTARELKDVKYPADSAPIRLVDKPDLSQTTIMLGAKTIGELHPDKLALSMGNYILGGGNFSSRLMNRVRSEIGKTYGIGSQLSCSREWGLFSISTTTQNRQLKEVLSVIHTVLEDLFENGVTDDELQKAKQFFIGHMAFELEGIHNVADKLLWLRFYGREKEYIEGYASRLAALTAKDINNALRNHYKHQQYATVAVGNRKEIESQLGGFGDLQLRGYRSDPYK